MEGKAYKVGEILDQETWFGLDDQDHYRAEQLGDGRFRILEVIEQSADEAAGAGV